MITTNDGVDLFVAFLRHTVFLLKIRHENNNIRFAEFNIQHSICVCILFPFIAYTRDDLCRKLETSFNHSVIKGAE